MANANAISGFHPVDRRASASSAVPTAELRSALARLLPETFRDSKLAIRLAGELHIAGGLCDIIALLAQAGRSGTLIVSSPDAVRAMAIERGELVGASTTAPGERIGEVLYRSGEIAQDDIEEATMIAAIDGRLIGEVLVGLGRVEERTLESLLTRQAEEIFYAALRVDDGVFCFVDERVSVPMNATTRPTLLSLLMEAARRMDEMLVFREVVGSSRHIPARLDDAGAVTLTDELASILELCDGLRSVADIGREVGLLEFEATRSIHQLASKGLLEILGPRVRRSTDVIAVYNDVLVEVHRQCDRLRCGDNLRRALGRYVACSEELNTLLHDVAPHDDGSLDVTRVLRNAGTARRDVLVRRVLRAYVDFAVFQAGSLLPSSRAAELPSIAGRLLAPLIDVEALSSQRPASIIAAG